MVAYPSFNISYVLIYKTNDLLQKLDENTIDPDLIDTIWQLIFNSEPFIKDKLISHDDQLPDTVFDNALHLNGEYLIPIMEKFSGNKFEFIINNIKPNLPDNLMTSHLNIDGAEMGPSGILYRATQIMDLNFKVNLDSKLLDKLNIPYQIGIHSTLYGTF